MRICLQARRVAGAKENATKIAVSLRGTVRTCGKPLPVVSRRSPPMLNSALKRTWLSSVAKFVRQSYQNWLVRDRLFPLPSKR